MPVFYNLEVMELALTRAGFAVKVENKMYLKCIKMHIDPQNGTITAELANRGGDVIVGKLSNSLKSNAATTIDFGGDYMLLPFKME